MRGSSITVNCGEGRARTAIVRSTFLLIALACLLWSPAAHARKIALIIGNSTYANTSALTNPANDAQIVANAARTAGFDVSMASDLTTSSFQRTLRDFRVAAEGADIAMIYYAGHGIEGQGKNWLLPVDAKLETQFDLPYEAINMDRLLEALAGAKVRMVVLDACRNNPFGNAWKSGVRAVANGLNGTEYDDVLVIFAAAPGQTATDGTGANSPFALSLAKRIPEPGLPLQMLGGAVRDDVLAATGGNQRPFVSASITGTPIFLVAAPRAVAAPVAPSPAVATAGGDRSMLDALMWQGASSSNTLAGYQAYLREFPSGIFSNVSRENIARLQGAAAPVAPAAAPPKPVVVATPSPVPNAAIVPAPAVASSSVGAGVAQAQPDTASYVGAVPTAEPGARPVPALPILPAPPQFGAQGYPTCREEFQTIAPTLERVAAINRCTVALDTYQKTSLVGFRQLMIDHQKAIADIYNGQVARSARFSADDQRAFYSAMLREHADSNPDGRHFSTYRATEARYKEDRAYMQDRYCFTTGCAGYAAPAYVPSPGASKK